MSQLIVSTIEKIIPPDQKAMEAAAVHWSAIAKPLHSMGVLEDIIVQLAGIQRNPKVQIKRKALTTFCADNGVIGENVSQSGNDVTAIVTENFLKGDATASICCRGTNTSHIVVDMGMVADIQPPAGVIYNPILPDREINNLFSACGKCDGYDEDAAKNSGGYDKVVSDDRVDCDKIASESNDDGSNHFSGDIKRPDITYIDAYKIAHGTQNMRKGPAMTREQAERALEIGIQVAMSRPEIDLWAIGEMGIGNTTSGSAMTSVFLGREPAEVTGRGAGLDNARLQNKIKVIEDAISLNQPDPADPIDVLAKVGGFDIAGMAGLVLGAAAMGKMVVVDGFISSVAGLLALRICPAVAAYIIASHVSKEPASGMVLEALEKEAVLHCNMFPGEGAGAVMFFPVLEMGISVYKEMPYFEQVNIEAYVPLS